MCRGVLFPPQHTCGSTVREISLFQRTCMLCLHVELVSEARGAWARGLERISPPAVKKPLKCSLVALQGAASHGHIPVSASAT